MVIAGDNSKFVSAGGDKQFFMWDVTTAQAGMFSRGEMRNSRQNYDPQQQLSSC